MPGHDWACSKQESMCFLEHYPGPGKVILGQLTLSTTL